MGSKVCALLSVAIAAMLSDMEAQLCQWNCAHPCVISVYTLPSLKCPHTPGFSCLTWHRICKINVVGGALVAQ